MANDPNALIKTVSNLSWNDLFKVLIFLGVAYFVGAEFFEDSADEAQSVQESGEYELLRDLSVSQITTLEALRGSIESKETRQDDKIEQLEQELNDL